MKIVFKVPSTVIALVVLMFGCGGGVVSDTSAQGPKLFAQAVTTTNGVATFSGNRTNYTITKTSSGYTVTDNVGSDGAVELTNVQTLMFSDAAVNLGIGAKSLLLSDANVTSLIELYVAYFNRIPDADGLSYWMDQLIAGHSLEQIGMSFYEAAVQYSALSGYSAAMTDEDFVRIIYLNVLGRSDPDEEGVDYWTTSLANGTQTRGSLINTMLSSAHTFEGDATYGAVADLLNNKITVASFAALRQGLTYNSPTESITKGMAIAAAVTATDTAVATGLVGVSDTDFNLLSTHISSAINFTTIAGSSDTLVNSIDGTGSDAQFYSPRGVAVDGAGNVFVADSSNNSIRKVTAEGVVTTFAGAAGIQGRTDGTGSAARFIDPYGIAVDSSGNAYIADTSNNTIRKITSAGVVTTLAGSAGIQGSTDGTGTAALFREPRGVAVDSNGNVYVADYGNQVVRKVTSAGVVTTLAGTAGTQGSTDGTGSAALFMGLLGVAVDSEGYVYVADTSNRTIRKITPDGVVTTLAGTARSGGNTDGTGAAARFSEPRGVTVDSSGTLYVADYAGQTIRKVTAAGIVTTLAGTASLAGSTDGTGSAALFNYPSGVTADSVGNVYVADTSNNTVRKITAAGVVTTLAGLAGRSSSVDGVGVAARFEDPYAAAADSSGNVYVADATDHSIRKITSAGVVSTLAGNPGSFGSTDGTGNAALFKGPLGIAVDSTGTVYVADTGNNVIRKITAAGVVTTFAGTAGSNGSTDGTGSAARFSEPNGIAIDRAGNLYVADTANNTVRKITSAGVVTTLAGSPGVTGLINDTGTAARFRVPFDVAVDTWGNVFVCDHGNHVIRKITPAGVVTTLAGSGSAGSSDGVGATASFRYPTGVATNSSGTVFVADTDNHVIRQITSAGVVTTIGGSASTNGSTDGVSSAARFFNPKDVTVDGSDNLYVVDRGNHTIRKGV